MSTASDNEVFLWSAPSAPYHSAALSCTLAHEEPARLIGQLQDAKPALATTTDS